MIRQCRSIREIYDEVRDFDLVITSDAPLRTALNALLDVPRLGPFAVTPRELAGRTAPFVFDAPVLDDRATVLSLARLTGLPLAQADHHFRRICQIWEHTGHLDGAGPHLAPSGDAPSDTRRVWEALRDLPTLPMAMERFNARRAGLDQARVAVIAPELQCALDARVRPVRFTSVAVLTDTAWPMPPVHLLPGEGDIADRIADLIQPGNADNVAIVLDFASPLRPLVMARLINAGIPVSHTVYLADDPDVRTFLDFVRAAFDLAGLRMRDLVPFSAFGRITVVPEFNNFRATEYAAAHDDKDLTAFLHFMAGIGRHSFADALKRLKINKTPLPGEFHELVDTLGLMQCPVTPASLQEIIYALENFPVQTHRHRRGVVLLNGLAAGFVHKPVCIFAGLDESWTRSVERHAWIDAPAEEARHIEKFQIMLQQGGGRLFLAPAMRNGKPVAPCFHFNRLFGREIAGFGDPIFTARSVGPVAMPPAETPRATAGQPATPAKPAQPLTSLSASSLNAFTACPRRYAHDRFKVREEQPYFLKGTLLHEFAALFAAHPEAVEQAGLAACVEHMTAVYRGMAGPESAELQRAVFHVGALNIMNFIRNLELAPPPLPAPDRPPERPNSLARKLGVTLDARHIEYSFRDVDRMIHGFIDLVANPGLIIDYKTGGTRRTGGRVVREALPACIRDQADFQPLLYITALRRRLPGRPIDFTYYYCLANFRDVIDRRADDDANRLTVRYEPLAFGEFLAAEPGALGGSKEREAFIEAAGPALFTAWFRAHPLPAEPCFDKDRFADGEWARTFRDHLLAEAGRGRKTAAKAVDAIIKRIVALRTADRCQPRFFKDDADGFETFVAAQCAAINACLAATFPCRPLSRETCRDCPGADICLRESAS